MDRRDFLKSALALAALAPLAKLHAKAGADGDKSSDVVSEPGVTRRRYKETAMTLPLLGFGCMRLPRLSPDKPEIDFDTAAKMIDMAMKAGCNYFDTAYMYHNGLSERFLGEALKKYPRDSYYLTDKMPVWFAKTPGDIEKIFNEQLKRCQTEYFDFYLLHSLDENHWSEAQKLRACEFLDRMKKEGKITYLGFSNHASPETLRRFADAHKWDFAQIQMNYLDWEFSTSEEEYNILTERNIPVVVMESVRGGRLSNLTPELNAKLEAAQPGRSVSSWAFRWLMRHENVMVMLSGMSTMEQVEDNLKTFESDCALSDEQCAFLKEVAHEFKKSLTVPCTACRYCTDDCPQQLDIPGLLRVYNDYKYDGWWHKGMLKDFAEDKLPSNCLGCGTCTGHCPQGIDIPSYMKKLANLQETGKE